MCGITGFRYFKSLSSSFDFEVTLKTMTDALKHRGPDNQGVWLDRNNQLALGHRRLSIIDLSVSGAQPMTSQSGRYVIVYNGEIYNATSVREKLQNQGITFKGRSDTEVLLECCACYGVKEAVKQLIGMFAFSIWDKTLSRQGSAWYQAALPGSLRRPFFIWVRT